MFNFNRYTPRQFAFVLITGIAILGFLAMLLFEATNSRRMDLRFAEGDLHNLSQLLDRHARATVEKIDVALQAGVREYQPIVIAGRDAKRLPQGLLADLLVSIPEASKLRIVNAAGDAVADASGKLPKGNVADRKYFLRNQNDPRAGLVISEALYSRFTNDWVFNLSRRFQGGTGEFLGVIQATVPADYFENFYKSLNVGGDRVIAFYDSELHLISRYPSMPEKLGVRMEGSRIEQLLASGMTSGTFETESMFGGGEYLYSFSKLQGLPFVVVVGRSKHSILADWTNKVLLYGIGALILSVLVFWMIMLGQRNYRLAVERGNAMAGAYDETVRHMLALLNSMPNPAWLKDKEGYYISINEAFAKLMNRTVAELIGKRGGDIFPPEVAEAFGKMDQKVLETQTRLDNDGSLVFPDGSVRLFEYTRTPVRDESGTIIGIAGVANDVTERSRAEERIRYLAEYDQLTDLPNRVVLGRRLADAIADPTTVQRGLALLMVDLDRFKIINEMYGHDVGDGLLQEMARRLLEIVADRGMVSRHGGDQFALLLNDTGSAMELASFAGEIVGVSKKPYFIGMNEFAMTASIGIAIYPQDGSDFGTLLRNADAAMYFAKDAGKGSFQFFSPDMNERVFERLSMENSLRRAIEQKEFEVYYQPKFAVADRRLKGFEALLRWPHPEQGMIMPGRFIPVAEDTQLIIPIGEWVLYEACRQIRDWQVAGYEPVPVAVNLSSIQFRQSNLVDMVSDVLIQTGLDPRYLELEITESVVMHDSEKVIDILDQLKSLGVSLSIDDFGTGYSSLSYLKRFPIDKIKIDRSFIQHLPEDGDDAAIAETIIAIADRLHLEVVAEGVENEAQFGFLQSQKCDEAQGFLFSKPVPAQEAKRFMGDKSIRRVVSSISLIHGGKEDAS